MSHRTDRNSGFTLGELAVLILATLVLLSFIILLLAELFGRVHTPDRSTRCKSTLGQLYKGLRMYMVNFDDYLPAALHIGTKGSDLGGYHYHRFAIHEHADPSFSHVVSEADGAAGRDAEWTFRTNRIFWQCPAKGYTQDYFGPEIAFRVPATVQGGRFDGHAQYSALTAGVSSTQRPILTDVDASYAQPGVYEQADCKGPAHYTDLEAGWRVHDDRHAGRRGIFIGAGESLRTDSAYDTERFDFRHNGSCNVLYLDAHVAALRETDGAQLKRVHERWNALRVTDD